MLPCYMGPWLKSIQTGKGGPHMRARNQSFARFAAELSLVC